MPSRDCGKRDRKGVGEVGKAKPSGRRKAGVEEMNSVLLWLLIAEHTLKILQHVLEVLAHLSGIR